MTDFKQLRVSQVAEAIAVAIYRETSGFPQSEKYGLASQMRRAAISIGSNIAEGAGRNSDRYFARFLSISRGSAHELEFQLLTAQKLGFINASNSADLVGQVRVVSRMLNRLVASLRG